MLDYRLNADALRKIATANGDDSNRKICARSGVHETTLSFLMNGHRRPSLDAVLALSSAYGLTVNDLLQVGEAEEQPPAALAA